MRSRANVVPSLTTCQLLEKFLTSDNVRFFRTFEEKGVWLAKKGLRKAREGRRWGPPAIKKSSAQKGRRN